MRFVLVTLTGSLLLCTLKAFSQDSQDLDSLVKKQAEEIKLLRKEIGELRKQLNDKGLEIGSRLDNSAKKTRDISFARQNGKSVQVFGDNNTIMFSRLGILVNYTSSSVNIKEGNTTRIYDSSGNLKYTIGK